MQYTNLVSFVITMAIMGEGATQVCSNAQQCVQQNMATAQSNCNGKTNSQVCQCQAYQSAISSCFNGCRDQTSLNTMQQLQSSMAGCQIPSGTIPSLNNPFAANNNQFGPAATLIVDNGPTGLAIPISGNRNLNQQQATISMANSPIKINHSSQSLPSFLMLIIMAFPIIYAIYQ